MDPASCGDKFQVGIGSVSSWSSGSCGDKGVALNISSKTGKGV